MVVGYALGNRNDLESDIQILDEDNENIIRFSRNIHVTLSKVCLNSCKVCIKQRKENLTVPYSTIKFAKLARSKGAREIMYVGNERPDRYPQIKSLLELWGFNSYVDYLYTVIELGFLEGLIPVISLGFLTPQEIKKLAEVAGLIHIPLTSNEDYHHQDVFKRSYDKYLEIRQKNMEWSSKLGLPVNTGVVVGGPVSKTQLKEQFNFIKKMQEKYGVIHEVQLQNFVKLENPSSKKFKKSSMMSAYEQARSILGETVPIVIPVEHNPDIIDFVDAGLRDFGAISVSASHTRSEDFNFEQIAEQLKDRGFDLLQRFPLCKEFIFQEKYTKKLGQVFDPYRYKIKKDLLEKQKKDLEKVKV